MQETQPREVNGRYGHKVHSAPEVPLAEEVDGSFLFPPNEWPGGADQYLSFWRSTPISDEALTNFVSAYAADWDEWAAPLVAEHLAQWGNSEEALRIRRATTGSAPLLEARNKVADEYEARLEATRPRRIDNSLARHVARAAQIIHNRYFLRSEEDRDAVGRAVMYYNQDGEPWTAWELWDSYQLEELMPDAFYSRENKLQRELRELRGAILR